MPLTRSSNDILTTIRDAVAASGVFAETIVVLDPKTTTTTPYDPINDTGGSADPAVVLGPRAAMVTAGSDSSTTESGQFRVSVDYKVEFVPEPDDPIITKGLIVRVLAGGQVPSLTHLPIEVLSQPTGTYSALTILNGVYNGTPADPWVMA